MVQIIAIAAGGAVGALLRYWTSVSVHSLLGQEFPYGTLTVNVVGSLMMGFLYILLVEKMIVSAEWRAVLLIGLLGAFTTFSTFSLETLNLFEQGEQIRAVMNIFLSVGLCLGAAWLGMLAGRQI